MKKFTLILLLLILITNLPIFSYTQTYGKCIYGNCDNGQGTLTFPDGGKYVGQFEDGEFVGK